MTKHSIVRSGLGAVLVSLALLGATGAQAQQSGVYVGVDVAEMEFNARGFSSATPRTIGVSVGHRLHPNFAVEARLGTGLSDDNSTAGQTPVSVDIDQFYGFYGKGVWPLSDLFDVYGVLGYTYSDVEVSTANFSQTGSESGFAYGFGAQLETSFSTAVRLEYTRFMDGSNFQLDALTLGFRFTY